MREGTAGEAEALSESAGSKPVSTRLKRQALVLLVFRVALLSSDSSQQSRAGDQGRGPELGTSASLCTASPVLPRAPLTGGGTDGDGEERVQNPWTTNPAA